MKNLCLENYDLSQLGIQEIIKTEGGGLWEGTQGRLSVFAEFVVGLVEGFIECNCE